MFLGQFTYTLDDKGRITIPARFREVWDGAVVIKRGLESLPKYISKNGLGRDRPKM
jgi:DNA-binding transcriptional regulator/RsmH inhibitor MraZ